MGARQVGEKKSRRGLGKVGKACVCIWFEFGNGGCLRFDEECPVHRMDLKEVLKGRSVKPRKPKC